jgi:hypothetical protein
MARPLKRDEAVILELLADAGDYCFPFAYLMDEAQLDRKTVRRICRYLARRSLAECRHGLWTEEGEPAGSGYMATRAGRDHFEALLAKDKAA